MSVSRLFNSPSSRGSFPQFLRMFDDPFFMTPSTSMLYNSPLASALQNPVYTRTPSFDVSETPTSFRLQGELPGVDKSNLHLEFINNQTLSVRGRVDKTTERGNIDNGDRVNTSARGEAQSENAKETSSAVTQSDQNEQFWSQERVMAEFAREFRFPSQVDPQHVTASLKNGVLDVNVPKLHEPEKITIDIQ